MATFEQLLDYLGRDGVKEVVLASEAAPSVRIGSQLRALTTQTLSTEQLLRLVAATPLGPLVPKQDEPGRTSNFELGGRMFVTKLTRFGNRLQIRIGRSGERAAAPAEVAPLPAHGPSDPPPDADASPASRLGELPHQAALVARGAADAGLVALLRQAAERGASDLHLSSDRSAQLRVAGALVPHGPPIPHERVSAMVLSVLEPRHHESLAATGYADLSVARGAAPRLRANVCRHRAGIKGCFRLVPDTPSTLDQLGLPRELEKVMLYHQGLVVVSGPSGQGKSTTLASLVHLFNSARPVHIITVEDPVEIVHPVLRGVVSQREVGTHSKSFYAALKGSLRQDPDIIVIGELRDRETVEMALSAAETGHLVLATMSTPSAARTIDRIIDMFPPDDQPQVRATLAGALKLVISQRLLPTVDGKGMVAAIELITGSLPLWTLIRDSKLYQLPSLMQRGRSWGMIRLEESINALLEKGVVTLEVARANAHDPMLVGVASGPAAAGGASGAAGARTTEAKPVLGGLKNLFSRKD